jgi:hypothetical protein
VFSDAAFSGFGVVWWFVFSLVGGVVGGVLRGASLLLRFLRPVFLFLLWSRSLCLLCWLKCCEDGRQSESVFALSLAIFLLLLHLGSFPLPVHFC